MPQRHIKQPRSEERELKPDVPRPPRDRPDEPHLVHARHDERAGEQTRAERREARRQAAVVVPEAEVVRGEGPTPYEEVLDEDDRAERARPVPDQTEEVAQRVIELVLADDRQWDDTVSTR